MARRKMGEDDRKTHQSHTRKTGEKCHIESVAVTHKRWHMIEWRLEWSGDRIWPSRWPTAILRAEASGKKSLGATNKVVFYECLRGYGPNGSVLRFIITYSDE